MSDRLTSPAAVRNLEPIAARLATLLPAHARVLELASGPGQHAAALAARFPAMTWQPSDVDPQALASIEAWRAQCALANLRPALRLDVTAPGWWSLLGAASQDALLAVNLCHIAPWPATLGLLDGAAILLAAHGMLLVYGPFMREGRHTAPSNAAFDAALRAQDPTWGVRCLDEIAAAAASRGLVLTAAHPMPSNNLLAELRPRAGSD